jgi:type IV secretory pathway component VirB8
MFFKNDQISSNSKVQKENNRRLNIKSIYIFSMLGVFAIIYVVIIVPIEYFTKTHKDVHVKTQ